MQTRKPGKLPRPIRKRRLNKKNRNGRNRLYGGLGFREMGAYDDIPVEATIFMKKDLKSLKSCKK